MPARPAAAQHNRVLASLLAYAGLVVVWAGMIGLSLSSATALSTKTISLTAAQVRLVDIGFALPGLLIWATILFAGRSMWRYQRVISSSKESDGFKYVAFGIFALLAGLVVASYLGGLRQLVSRHAADPVHVKTAFVVINNYVSVAFGLLTYGLLLRGSQLLLRSIGKRLDLAKKRLVVIALVFVGLAALYLWLIHSNPASRMSVSPGFAPTFGLPYWMVVLTVALPLLVSWLVGAVALLGLYQYRLKTTGIVYKLLFKKFVVGMTVFICTSILLQLFTQLYNLYANSTLSSLLALIAVIYLVLAYAFVLVAQGAQKLNTIETLLIE